MKRSWSDEQLKEAIRSSVNFTGVTLALGLGRGNRKTVEFVANQLSIDTSHFRCHRFGNSHSRNSVKIEDILTDNSKYSSSFVKSKLFRHGVLDKKCVKCNLGEIWNGEPIVLQLDHINGNSFDNRIENLRILCPNCHSQTPTSCRRHKVHKVPQPCVRCGKDMLRNQGLMCRDCYILDIEPKIDWPDMKQLHDDVVNTTYSLVSKRLGVSIPTIKKRLKESGLMPNLKNGTRNKSSTNAIGLK